VTLRRCTQSIFYHVNPCGFTRCIASSVSQRDPNSSLLVLYLYFALACKPPDRHRYGRFWSFDPFFQCTKAGFSVGTQKMPNQTGSFTNRFKFRHRQIPPCRQFGILTRRWKYDRPRFFVEITAHPWRNDSLVSWNQSLQNKSASTAPSYPRKRNLVGAGFKPALTSGFRVALAIASLPGMTPKLFNGFREPTLVTEKYFFCGAPPVAPTPLPNSSRPTPVEAFSEQTVPGLAVRHARESYAEKSSSRPHKQRPVLNTNCNTMPLLPPSKP
jgi:hypothetical protein